MKMKSWRFHEFGHIKNLKMEETELPEPAEEEALVKVAYAGLNPADIFLVMGRYPHTGTLPYSVGRGGSGVVVKPGNSGRFREGDNVALLRSEVGITRDGMLAEYAAIPEAVLAPVPEWWSMEDAAAGPLVLLTNWQALKIASDMKSGENVVITAASGGIGTSALLLVKALGGKAIVLSRSEEKQTKLMEMGADVAFDTQDTDIVKKIKRAGGADIVLENICGEFLAKSTAMSNMFGRINIIGGLGGIKSEINVMQVLFKRLQIHGIQVGESTDEELKAQWHDIVETLQPGKIKVPIDRIFPFDQVQEAFEHMRQGPMGKVVVGPIAN